MVVAFGGVTHLVVPWWLCASGQAFIRDSTKYEAYHFLLFSILSIDTRSSVHW